MQDFLFQLYFVQVYVILCNLFWFAVRWSSVRPSGLVFCVRLGAVSCQVCGGIWLFVRTVLFSVLSTLCDVGGVGLMGGVRGTRRR